MSLLQLSPPRLLPAVGSIPFANYNPKFSDSYYHHTYSRPRIQLSRWTQLQRGLGSRHILDNAPFSLWDLQNMDFLEATDTQIAWIRRTYNAPTLTFEWPTLVIHTDTPPNPLPVTVAYVAARFVPAAHVWMSRIINNGLRNPRLPDPVPFRVQRWTEPNDEQVKEITAALMSFVVIKAINFTGVFIHVELNQDGRKYERHSLPGRVAGISTLYHMGPEDFWSDMSDHALSRLFDPNTVLNGSNQEDRSNYLQHGTGVLQPGVCLGSSPTTTAGAYSDSQMCTTAGVRLRNSSGKIVVIAANQGFLDSAEVFHPTTITGEKIGEIYERWIAQDIAMVQLQPAIQFSNKDYFNATPPRRLLRLGQSSYGQWCTADGMSCGTIFLQREGRLVSGPEY